MRTTVWITTQFTGFHRWKNAPDEVKFLRDYHRHIFHVKLGIDVTHQERQVEFFTMKRQVDQFIYDSFHNQFFDHSCETIATTILQKFNGRFCEVSEDGENGAIVENENAKTLLPSLQVKRKCFTGKEAEGPNKGVNVLFVPGSTSPEELGVTLYNLAETGLHDSRIYYGAGNDRTFRTDTFEVIRDWRHGDLIDVEVDRITIDVLSSITKDTTVISHLAFDLHGIPGVRVFHKRVFLDLDLVTWTGQDGKVYETKLSDPLYSQDRDVC